MAPSVRGPPFGRVPTVAVWPAATGRAAARAPPRRALFYESGKLQGEVVGMMTDKAADLGVLEDSDVRGVQAGLSIVFHRCFGVGCLSINQVSRLANRTYLKEQRYCYGQPHSKAKPVKTCFQNGHALPVLQSSASDENKLLRDLHDTLEREADLKEQMKFAEEEAAQLRKKLVRVEEENESLAIQLKKMAKKG